jgi:hypothetical protein
MAPLVSQRIGVATLYGEGLPTPRTGAIPTPPASQPGAAENALVSRRLPVSGLYGVGLPVPRTGRAPVPPRSIAGLKADPAAFRRLDPRAVDPGPHPAIGPAPVPPESHARIRGDASVSAAVDMRGAYGIGLTPPRTGRVPVPPGARTPFAMVRER